MTIFCLDAIENTKSDDLAGLCQGWMSFEIVKNTPVVYFNNIIYNIMRQSRGTGIYYYKSIDARLNNGKTPC